MSSLSVGSRLPTGWRPSRMPRASAHWAEAAILREGPDSVAAIIAEPVKGAGGVWVPSDDYFPRLREICDRYEVLLIADEVITGFGRTGYWFALERWGVQPDILSIAKAITSGYIPMGAFIVTQQILDALKATPADAKFMHAYTNSAHPTAAAVGLRNLQIMEDEHLVENAGAMGERLGQGLQDALGGHGCVTNLRHLGLMAGFMTMLLFVYLYFAVPALIMDDLGVRAAIVQSMQLVRSHFLPTLGFVLLTNLIGLGLGLIFVQLADNSLWGALVAIPANAFIGTGLAIALLLFYRTRVLLMAETVAMFDRRM